MNNSLRLSLIKSDVNIRLVVGGRLVEEVNLDVAVVELLDELDAAISLTEDEETDVILDCDIDVILVVQDVDVDEVASWGLVVNLGTLESLPADFESGAFFFVLVEWILE